MAAAKNQTAKTFPLTPAAGKRLIAKGLADHPVIREVLESGTLVIVAGTTNGCVAEEILAAAGGADDFSRRRFFRGITLPPGRPTTESGRLPDESEFPGDVVLKKGVWQKGKTIFDVVEELKEGDVILKGANAVDLASRRAAVLIGHPKAGTVGAAVQAAAGRRVCVILPVGLEKRIPGNLDGLALLLNSPGAEGPRLFPVPGGAVYTELDALAQLTGADAEVAAAGGVCGAEGSVWLALTGTREQIRKAEKLLHSISAEPAFAL
ncbi:MAG: hypothetical protein JW929_06035 [Anaerolineales bacterium]|nr:hypothetical protein [Anaerolineales bacterium]